MTQPEALRLADALASWEYTSTGLCGQAAAELRRLYDLADKYKWQVIDTCARAEKATAQRDALLAALLRIESAVDWYLGRSSFTQTTQLKGLGHSANVRKELFAAHDAARAAIAKAEENT